MIAARGQGRPRWSIEARQMLAACLALSVALHMLLLTIRSTPSGRPGPVVRGARDAPGSIYVRLIRAAPSESPGATPTAGLPLPPLASADATERMRAEPPPAAALQPPAQASIGAPADAAPRSATDMAATAVAPSPPGPDHDEYVPRQLLSVPPVAQTSVIIAPPPGESDGGRHVGVLSLFIDEHGQVRKVVGDGPALPPAMERAAREAFMAARFTPGQIDGHEVKSRIRVEVVFDTEALPKSVSHSP